MAVPPPTKKQLDAMFGKPKPPPIHFVVEGQNPKKTDQDYELALYELDQEFPGAE